LKLLANCHSREGGNPRAASWTSACAGVTSQDTWGDFASSFKVLGLATARFAAATAAKSARFAAGSTPSRRRACPERSEGSAWLLLLLFLLLRENSL
jgi:hypothetical protein